MTTSGRLSLEDLKQAAAAGEIQAVLLAFVDMFGRLQGKRCSPRYFVEEVCGHGAGACNYLLSVNVEMEPQPGYAMAGWDQGFGDFQLIPDLTTLRMTGWRADTAICLSDARWHDGTPVLASPREILRTQIARLAERGWAAQAATELEFIAHRESYAQAQDAGYRNLTPVNRFNIDYSLWGVGEVEPLIGGIAAALERAGLDVESAKGEANRGQHEINIRFDEALATADNHVLFKHTVKEVARQQDMSATFMAKWDQREGNSCHVHFSLQDAEGASVFANNPKIFEQFVAGQLACMRELTLAFAPNINSYKRFAANSFAPTAIAWGRDNRTCAIRLVGDGAALRFENRLAGADVNPYFVLAATIAAGLHGIDSGLSLPPEETGDAYSGTHERVAADLADAATRFRTSEVARRAFGDSVVDHYSHAADLEAAEFRSAVTDWERARGYERL